MKKHLLLIGIFSVLAFGLNASQLEANFVQCPAVGGVCGGGQGVTNDADLINGSSLGDIIGALAGDDVAFGNDGEDTVNGADGNDIVLGGLDADVVIGGEGNDILLAGPDDGEKSQDSVGGAGNDTYHVLAGEITTCLFIFEDSGFDLVNLIGFGPYSATIPFGQPGFVNGWIYVIDPITGGEIFIEVIEGGDVGVEIVNGLPSPNITIVPFFGVEETACPLDPFS